MNRKKGLISLIIIAVILFIIILLYIILSSTNNADNTDRDSLNANTDNTNLVLKIPPQTNSDLSNCIFGAETFFTKKQQATTNTNLLSHFFHKDNISMYQEFYIPGEISDYFPIDTSTIVIKDAHIENSVCRLNVTLEINYASEKYDAMSLDLILSMKMKDGFIYSINSNIGDTLHE